MGSGSRDIVFFRNKEGLDDSVEKSYPLWVVVGCCEGPTFVAKHVAPQSEVVLIPHTPKDHFVGDGLFGDDNVAVAIEERR